MACSHEETETPNSPAGEWEMPAVMSATGQREGFGAKGRRGLDQIYYDGQGGLTEEGRLCCDLKGG